MDQWTGRLGVVGEESTGDKLRGSAHVHFIRISNCSFAVFINILYFAHHFHFLFFSSHINVNSVTPTKAIGIRAL